VGGDENMEEVEKNERKTEEVSEKSDAALDILISSIYAIAAEDQRNSLINKLYNIKINSKSDFGDYQFLNHLNKEIQRYSWIIQRNIRIVINAAKTFFEPTEEFYRKLAERVNEKGLPFYILLNYAILLPGDPEFQRFSFSLMNPRTSKEQRKEAFISHKTREIYYPRNKTGEMLISAILEVIRKKNRR